MPSNNLWAFKADPSQADQILANLCVNARDSITDIGTITIRTGNSVVDDGYTLLVANTPGEAPRLAKEHSGEIDLLITDVIMPAMNGKDLAHNLMSLNPNLKYLFMSGYTADAISQHGVLEEGVHFIHKPFSLPDLAIKVRKVLDCN